MMRLLIYRRVNFDYLDMDREKTFTETHITEYYGDSGMNAMTPASTPPSRIGIVHLVTVYVPCRYSY
jgi:hypothetical protein